MPPLTALAANGVRKSAASAGAGTVRSAGASIARLSELTQLSDRFDVLLRDASVVKCQRDYDRLADEARDIAGELNTIFRGSSGTPSHPPRWQNGGKAAW